MATTKARKLVPFRDYTHTLGIALGGPSFRRQLQTSLERFENTSNMPLELASRLYLGKIYLSPKKKEKEFPKVLHGLDYRKLLGPTREIAQSPPVATNQNATAQPLVPCVTPLRIDLKGLMTLQYDSWETRPLLAIPIDPTDRLDRFWQSVKEVFCAAGFPVLEGEIPRTHAVANLGEPQDYVNLFNGLENSHEPEFRVPVFDARGKINACENEILATDVHLQRLCVYELDGPSWPRGYNSFFQIPDEIDSVALP